MIGAGVATAPGLLADVPRWLEWWWNGPRGGLEALRVNLDPAAPDFFEYTTADWYETPRRTGRPRMAGPYVDYACTNQYAITLSAPATTADGFLGVAAADILLASLEKRLMPPLAALGRPVALTNAEGRVIASTSASMPAGRRLELSREAARRGRTRSPMRSWLLLDL